MPGQSTDIAGLFEKRMQVIGKISQETAEHMRLLQLSSGAQVLLMKASEAEAGDAAQQDAEAQLEACQHRLDALELELAGVDEQIATATQKEDENG